MNKPEHIDVQVEVVGESIVFRPSGEIDLGRAPSLRMQLKEAQAKKSERLIVDLVNVPYMDSSGVATLIEAMQTARKTGARLVLCGLQDKVRSIFEIAKLNMVFTIVPGLEDAHGA